MFEFAFSFSYNLCLVPSPKAPTAGENLIVDESHNGFKTLFSMAVLQGPGAGLLLTLFTFLG
jgi:hypothetical protein